MWQKDSKKLADLAIEEVKQKIQFLSKVGPFYNHNVYGSYIAITETVNGLVKNGEITSFCTSDFQLMTVSMGYKILAEKRIASYSTIADNLLDQHNSLLFKCKRLKQVENAKNSNFVIGLIAIENDVVSVPLTLPSAQSMIIKESILCLESQIASLETMLIKYCTLNLDMQ